MKTNKLGYLIWSAAILIATAGCKKYSDPYTNYNIQKTVFTLLKEQPQNFEIDAGQAQMIVGAQGNRIRFTPTSFKNASGAYVQNGKVNIELIETPKAKDMLLNGVTTRAGSQLLQSAGSMYIQARQDGQVLKAGDYSVDFLQDGPTTNQMQLFAGVDSNNIISWSVDPLDTLRSAYVDTANYYFGHYVRGHFDWINCDRFYNDPAPRTDVKITTSGVAFNFGETMAFIVIPSLNANINLRNTRQGTANMFEVGADVIPTGLKVHCIVIGMHDGKFYYGATKNQTVGFNFSRQINLTETTIEKIKSEIKAL